MVSENNMKMENILFLKDNFHSFFVQDYLDPTKRKKKKDAYIIFGSFIIHSKMFQASKLLMNSSWASGKPGSEGRGG